MPASWSSRAQTLYARQTSQSRSLTSGRVVASALTATVGLSEGSYWIGFPSVTAGTQLKGGGGCTTVTDSQCTARFESGDQTYRGLQVQLSSAVYFPMVST